ncbi:MAG: hypothetical protein ACOC33_00765 [bacterium]
MSHNFYESLYLYFDKLFNYNKQLNDIKEYHNLCLNTISNLDHLKLFLKDNNIKYLSYFKTIETSDYNLFNQVEIRNKTFETNNELLEKIYDSDIIQLYSSISNMPETKKEIDIDISIYKTLINEIPHSQDLSRNFYSYISEKTYRNFYDLIYSNKQNIDIQNSSFIVYYYLYSLISSYINNRLNYIEKLRDLTKTKYAYFNNISNDFFSEESSNSFCDSFINILLHNTYQFSSISTTFINSTKNYVLTHQLPILKESIDDYFKSINYNLLLKLNDNIHRLLYHKVIDNVVKDCYQHRNNYLTFDQNTSERNIIFNYEFKVLNKYLISMNDISFDKYDTLLNYYRNNFDKFINIIPILSQSYIDDSIKTTKNSATTAQLFNNILNLININNNKLEDYVSYINQYSYFNNIFLDDDSLIFDYAKYLTLSEHINIYIKSSQFEETIDKILYNIYKYLRNLGYVYFNQDWSLHKDVIILFIHAFLNNQLFKNNFLNDLKVEYIDIVESEINGQQNISGKFNEFIETEKQAIKNFNYRQMWMFYENMISSTLTIHNIDKIHDKYLLV